MIERREAVGVRIVHDDAPETPGVYTRAPSLSENFLIDWAFDLRKKSLERTLDALHRLAATSTGLLGGSVAFLKPDVMPNAWRAVVMGLLLTTLALALIGASVRMVGINPVDTERTHEVTAHVSARRAWWLRYGMVSLWASLAAAVVGVCVNSF